jgi:hypothetical protein
VRTKTNTKTFEEEEELIFCKKEFRERAKIFSRKRKKTGKSKEERVANHTKNARVYVTTGGEKSDDDE